jgi:hypothetical protein
MSASQAQAKVRSESLQVADARRALETRAGQMNPLALTGGALLLGLVAGRLLGRPTIPKSLTPTTLLASALQRPLSGLLERLFSTLLWPASGDSKSDSPPGTQSRAP